VIKYITHEGFTNHNQQFPRCSQLYNSSEQHILIMICEAYIGNVSKVVACVIVVALLAHRI